MTALETMYKMIEDLRAQDPRGRRPVSLKVDEALFRAAYDEARSMLVLHRDPDSKTYLPPEKPTEPYARFYGVDVWYEEGKGQANAHPNLDARI